MWPRDGSAHPAHTHHPAKVLPVHQAHLDPDLDRDHACTHLEVLPADQAGVELRQGPEQTPRHLLLLGRGLVRVVGRHRVQERPRGSADLSTVRGAGYRRC